MANSDPFNEYAVKVVGTIALHPITFSRVLAQLGWEPDPPKLGKTLLSRIGLGKEKYFYPNLLHHVGRVKEELGGVFPLWTTGLLANVAGRAVRDATMSCMSVVNPKFAGEKSWEADAVNYVEVVQRCCYLSISRSVGVVLAYPLYTVMVRQMASAVGHDAAFSGNLLSVAKEVLDSEGVKGFFAGVSVAVMGDLVSLWATSSLAYIFNRFVFSDGTAPDVKQVSNVLASFLVTSWSYRYGVVSTNLCVRRSTSLSLCVPYTSNAECWQALRLSGELNRGESLFFRAAPTRK